MSYLVHLRQFEGPLGLLLYLIRKEEMDIFNINIYEITKQYLDYIRMMKELDLEVAGDFVAMAATLIHIKSQMLLPQYNEAGEVIEAEDPRKELVQKLLEYQRFQASGKQIYERALLNRDVWPRGYIEEIEPDEASGEIILEEAGLFSMIASYRRVLRKMKKAVHQVRDKVQSISSRVMEIKDRLIIGRRVLLSDLVTLEGPHRRAQLLITFLSLPELGRMGFVHLFQSETYGEIHVEPKKAIERNVLERVQEFDSADADQVAQNLFNNAMEERIAQAEAEAAGEVAPSLLVPDVIEGANAATDDEIMAAEAQIGGESGSDLALALETDAASEQLILDTTVATNLEAGIETSIEAGIEAADPIYAAYSVEGLSESTPSAGPFESALESASDADIEAALAEEAANEGLIEVSSGEIIAANPSGPIEAALLETPLEELPDLWSQAMVATGVETSTEVTVNAANGDLGPEEIASDFFAQTDVAQASESLASDADLAANAQNVVEDFGLGILEGLPEDFAEPLARHESAGHESARPSDLALDLDREASDFDRDVEPATDEELLAAENELREREANGDSGGGADGNASASASAASSAATSVSDSSGGGGSGGGGGNDQSAVS